MEKFSRSAFTLEESPDSQSNYRNWHNCVGTHTHTNGDQYIGEWQDGNIPGVYLATMHSGVTLAPIIGELVAMELLDGAETNLLADFRPDRFI